MQFWVIGVDVPLWHTELVHVTCLHVSRMATESSCLCLRLQQRRLVIHLGFLRLWIWRLLSSGWSASFLPHGGFLLDSIFDPEDGGEASVDFHRNWWCFIPEDVCTEPSFSWSGGFLLLRNLTLRHSVFTFLASLVHIACLEPILQRIKIWLNSISTLCEEETKLERNEQASTVEPSREI